MAKKQSVWYGCKDCNYIQPKDKDKSTKNWDIVPTGKCPKCGKDMHMQFGEPPKKITI